MRLNQDQLVDAICLHTAERHDVPVQSVEVELLYDEELGFSAKTWAHGRERILVEANMKESIMRYMLDKYNMRVYPSQISLDVEDEMWADIAV